MHIPHPHTHHPSSENIVTNDVITTYTVEKSHYILIIIIWLIITKPIKEMEVNERRSKQKRTFK